MEPDRREKWMNEILKHQIVDEHRMHINICARHFEASDFKKQNVLAKSAVPKIFAIREENGTEIHSVNIENEKCNCEVLQCQVDSLKADYQTLNAKYNIEVEKLRQKIRVLEANKNEIKKEICKEKAQNKRLTDTLTELRRNRFISPDDKNVLNVNLFTFSLLKLNGIF